MQGRKSQKPRSNTGPGVAPGFNIAVKASKYEVVTLSVAKQDSKVGLEAISWLAYRVFTLGGVGVAVPQYQNFADPGC